jgi:hypothetical protein
VISTSAYGGPWKRGQLPDCAHEELLNIEEVVGVIVFLTPFFRWIRFLDLNLI